ncbi:MAG: DNA polymerase III subunit beta, partial [Thermoleophilaceae bacterium]
MKFTVSRETFLARLSIVARAASTRSAIQTLAGVLIRLEGGKAELQATDTDLGIRAAFDADIQSEGSVVVPGRLLLDVARSL